MLRIGLPVAVGALILDQLSKWWIRVVVMDPPHDIPIASFFSLVLAWNRGISFSFFRSDAPFAPYVFSAVALAIVAGLVIWMYRMDRAWPAVAVALIVGGAIGNVVDRLIFGAVVDFLFFHGEAYPGFCAMLDGIGLGGFDCRWPAFNLADSFIFIGVALLLADGLFARPKTAKTAAN